MACRVYFPFPEVLSGREKSASPLPIPPSLPSPSFCSFHRRSASFLSWDPMAVWKSGWRVRTQIKVAFHASFPSRAVLNYEHLGARSVTRCELEYMYALETYYSILHNLSKIFVTLGIPSLPPCPYPALTLVCALRTDAQSSHLKSKPGLLQFCRPASGANEDRAASGTVSDSKEGGFPLFSRYTKSEELSGSCFTFQYYINFFKYLQFMGIKNTLAC